MQGLEKLAKLAEYAQAQYEQSGTIVVIEALPLGFSIRVSYRPKGQVFQLLRVISTLEFDVLDLQGLQDRIDRMVREVHLKYVQVAALEKYNNADSSTN